MTTVWSAARALFFGLETRGKSIEQIDKELNATADVEASATIRRA